MLQKYPMYAYIPANDVARARQFYERNRSAQGIGPAALPTNSAKGALLPLPRGAAGTPSVQAFWCRRSRSARCVPALSRREFEDYDEPDMKTVNGIFVGGGAKAAWFKDTEGNIMALVQDTR